MQTIKKIIKKCKKEKQSLHLAMLNLRATPVDSKLPSPAEMLMGRPITTLLPSRTSPSPVTVAQRQHLDRRQLTMKSSYDFQARVSLLSTKDRTSVSWTKQARPGYRVKSQDTAENQGPTTSEQTRGPISDATEETLGKLPSRTVQTLETGLVWQPRLILGQPHWNLPLPSVQSTVLQLIMRLNHLRSLVKRPLKRVLVGWSEPLHVIMNIPVEQDYHIEHGKATNQQVND